MVILVLIAFIDLFVEIFDALILIRVIMSYVVHPSNRFYVWLVNVTEPVLSPVRRILPRFPGLDLAPVVTFFLLQGIQYAVHWWFGG